MTVSQRWIIGGVLIIVILGMAILLWCQFHQKNDGVIYFVKDAVTDESFSAKLSSNKHQPVYKNGSEIIIENF